MRRDVKTEEPCFAEPSKPDPTWGEANERLETWLSRSTLPRAEAARTFLNYNIAQLPEPLRRGMCAGLHTKEFPSRYFELLVARTLQCLGGGVSRAAQNEERKRPDFDVEFGDGQLVVEATAPEFASETKRCMRYDEPLRELVRKSIPDGWSATIRSLPAIGPSDPKRPLRIILKGLPSVLDKSVEDVVELSESVLTEDDLALVLRRRDGGEGGVRMGPVYTAVSKAEHRIRKTVAKKRRQVRSSSPPVILAIGGDLTVDPEDFDGALFGRTCEWRDANDKLVRTGWTCDGIFAEKKAGKPTYAGVLAFFGASLSLVLPPAPVLYVHPRHVPPLPERLLSLQTRKWIAEMGIVVTPARGSNPMKQMGFPGLRNTSTSEGRF